MIIIPSSLKENIRIIVFSKTLWLERIKHYTLIKHTFHTLPTFMATEIKESGAYCDGPHNVKMYGSVIVGSKWQVVIPSALRTDLHINPGDQMFVMTKHNKLVGLIKLDDMQTFLTYMQEEMDVIKEMAKNHHNN